MKVWFYLFLLVSFCVQAQDELNCAEARTTPDINQCKNKEFIVVDDIMERYLAKSIESYADDSVQL